MWKKIKRFFNDLCLELKDWKTLVLFIIVVVIIGASVWFPLLIGIISGNAWWLGLAGVIEAVWLGPVPFIPICIAITLIIKRIFTWRKNKK